MVPEIATTPTGCAPLGVPDQPTTDFLSVMTTLLTMASLAVVVSCASRDRVADVLDSSREESSGTIPEVKEPCGDGGAAVVLLHPL